jgi:hypothetical protein
MFLTGNSKSNWNKRYPTISKILVDHKVNVSIEMGIARGDLIYFLLGHNKDLSFYHGDYPFLGKILVQQLRLSSLITTGYLSFYNVQALYSSFTILSSIFMYRCSSLGCRFLT